MGLFIRKIMEIGSGENSITTEDVSGISGSFDMDALCGSVSFNLPYPIPLPDSSIPQYNWTQSKKEGVDISRLKKYDRVKIYYLERDVSEETITHNKRTIFSEFTTREESYYTINGEEMIRIFDGYVDSVKLSKNKSSIDYSIEALGMLGISNERNLAYQRKEGTSDLMINTWLQLTGIQKGDLNEVEISPQLDLIPSDKVRFLDVDSQNFLLISSGGTTLKNVLESIRKKYALIIHQSGDGYVNVMTPFSLLSSQENEILGVNAWQFNVLEGNVFNVNYGELQNNYNAVVVLGASQVLGVAIDPIAVSNNNGNVNYLVMENRNLFSDEDCQKVARNKLLDMSKNYYISFRTKFNPHFMIGQPFQIQDNDRFTGNEVMTIKRYEFTIDKNDVSCVIHGFAHGATLIPEDIALSDSGVLDIDFLEIPEKEILSSDYWKGLG